MLGRLDRLFYYFLFYALSTTEIYTLSLHDALPISESRLSGAGDDNVFIVVKIGVGGDGPLAGVVGGRRLADPEDRKSTRLNSSHSQISYAVFCLKKKN